MTTQQEERRIETPSGTHYVTKDSVRRAVALVAPMIEHWRRDRGVVGSGFLYLVVMDPARPPGSAPFEDAILHEHAFGDRDAWDADYAAFARAKAKLSWTTGRDGRTVQSSFPHLLHTGDTLIAGGVCLDGLVVAASGAFPCFDELFAGTVALALRALARHARESETSAVTLDPREPEPALLRPA